jgi:hypothetical protein
VTVPDPVVASIRYRLVRGVAFVRGIGSFDGRVQRFVRRVDARLVRLGSAISCFCLVARLGARGRVMIRFGCVAGSLCVDRNFAIAGVAGRTCRADFGGFASSDQEDPCERSERES